MALLAVWATARGCKASAFLELISAGHALKWEDGEALSLTGNGPGDVGEVIVDLPFPNAQCLGEFPPVHVLF